MKQHRYRITVEHIATADGDPINGAAPLEFEVGNHDDVLALVERMRQRDLFEANTATAFTVGLKLFNEVMLENRKHPLFEEFRPHFAEFMKRLKSTP